ncbi:MAG: hypothetical protein OEU50_00150 [Gammaproteobacteria bacterium]|nr:hypothetical protein [Gammaproteobacteria bacterium]
MSVKQIIETYLKGWQLSDGNLSLSVTADSFHYDDPNSGRISRDEFVAFVDEFKRAAVSMGGEIDANPFLQYSDVVIKDDELPATVWCWWQAVGTELQGCALVKVAEEGVMHEKIAYFSRLPD